MATASNYSIEFSTMNSKLYDSLIKYSSHPKFNFIRVSVFCNYIMKHTNNIASSFETEEYNSSNIDEYCKYINEIYMDMKLPSTIPDNFRGHIIPKIRQISYVKITFCDYYNNNMIEFENTLAFNKIKQLL